MSRRPAANMTYKSMAGSSRAMFCGCKRSPQFADWICRFQRPPLDCEQE